jgi:hypothetical protein
VPFDEAQFHATLGDMAAAELDTLGSNPLVSRYRSKLFNLLH